MDNPRSEEADHRGGTCRRKVQDSVVQGDDLSRTGQGGHDLGKGEPSAQVHDAGIRDEPVLVRGTAVELALGLARRAHEPHGAVLRREGATHLDPTLDGPQFAGE